MGKFGKELRGFGGGSLESLWIAAPVSRAVEEDFGGTQVGEVGCAGEVRSARSEARREQKAREIP